MIEQGAQLADREDPDVGGALLDLFHDEGIEVVLGTQVSRVEGLSGKEVRVYAKDGAGERIVEGTDLLVSVGRTPNTKGIGLEQVGIELDERAYIKVNDRLETTASNVWAMGDCAGSPQFTHVAYHDFRVVHENLNGGNRTTKDRIVPFCKFTDPELARVGRNETEAKRDQIEYRVANADGECATHPHDCRTARLYEDADRQRQRRNRRLHRVWYRGKRADGGSSDRDGWPTAVHRVARCDLRSPDDGRGVGLSSRTSRKYQGIVGRKKPQYAS